MMKTRQEYINIILSCSNVLRQKFGVRTLRLFGSVARGEQKKTSDVDICVDTETPNPFLLWDLREFLETKLSCPVDLLRTPRDPDSIIKREIEKDGIFVIQ